MIFDINFIYVTTAKETTMVLLKDLYVIEQLDDAKFAAIVKGEYPIKK